MRALLNRWRRWLWQQLFYRMVFGEQGRAGQALPHTRIAPSTCIEGEAGLELADHVFIGQFNFLDATAGLRIAEGVQITNFVSIVTHSSHRS
ncbi:MAG TPA: acyltransferase, partial [Giesbergeria sp.]|nr:acyltransferase [Giesbergeria sp.]